MIKTGSCSNPKVKVQVKSKLKDLSKPSIIYPKSSFVSNVPAN